MSIIKDKISNKNDRQSTTGEKLNTSKDGLPDGWTRTTLAIREDQLEALKVLAWWERTTIKALLERILDQDLATRDMSPILNEKNKAADKRSK